MPPDKTMLTFQVSVPLHSLALASLRLIMDSPPRKDAIPLIMADRLQESTRPITDTTASDLRDYLVVASADATMPVKIAVDQNTQRLLARHKEIVSRHLGQTITDSQALMVILIDFVIEHTAVSLVNAKERKRSI